MHVSTHGNGLHGGVNLEQRLDCLLPSHPPANRQIQDHHIKVMTKALRFFVNLDGRLAIFRQLHLMAHPPERQPDNSPHRLLIIHHQHPPMPRNARRHRCFLSAAQLPGRGKVDVEGGPNPHL